MSEHILKCTCLTKCYGKKPALTNVNLELERGKIIGLLGPNGSGKTTLIKLANGLLTPSDGEILIDGKKIGVETKKIVSYLPDKTYLDESMKVSALLKMFADFYSDFNMENATQMIEKLGIDMNAKLKTLSKGNKEKVQLILVMSRRADLYLLDEPIGGVDPATRDYILDSIIRNYNENASVIISTHLISDVEKVLDEVIFIKNGEIVLHDTVDNIRETQGKSVDEYFREVFRC
jgi:ABC-2 type transport system ATP-binding protein